MRTYSTAGQQRSANYRRERCVNPNVVPRDKLPAFVRLIDAAAARKGSIAEACRVMGIPDGAVHRWREGSMNMRVETGRRVLAGWKAIKEGRA